MGSDNYSVNSCNQDNLMVKINTDTICPDDILLDSGGHSSKNCTKKSIYDTYQALSTEVVPINLTFSMKDIICSFEMNDWVEVADSCGFAQDYWQEKVLPSGECCPYHQIGFLQQEEQ